MTAGSPSEAARPRVSGAVLALLAYCAVTAVLFFSVLGDLSHTIVGGTGEGDKFYFPWYFWHFKEAVLHGSDPAYTTAIFALYPCEVPVLEGTLFGAVGGALTVLFGPLAAYNLLVITSFPLTGLAVYMLAGELVPNKIARFAAGFFYTFTTFHFFVAAGHPQVVLEFIPLFAWRLLAFYRTPTLRNAIVAGIALAVVPLFDVYFGAYFVLPFVLFAVAAALAFDRPRLFKRSVAIGAAVIVVTAVLMTAYDAAGLLSLPPDIRANIQETSAGASGLAADLAAFVLPNPFNPLVGAATLPMYEKMTAWQFPIEQSVYLGYVPLALAVAALCIARTRGSRRVRFWAAFGAVGVLLALGPELYVLGHRIIHLPFYRAIYGWSVLSSFRAPNRLVVIPLLTIALLAAVTLDHVASVVRTRRGAVVLNSALAAALLVSLATNVVFGVPYPSARVAVSPVYGSIAADTSDGLLLDLPLSNAFSVQFAQTVHHKRLVNGIATRFSPEMHASAESVPYVATFDVSAESSINVAGARDGRAPKKVDLKAQWIRRNIRYVVLHRAMDPDSYRWATAFLTANLGEPALRDEAAGLLVWHL